VYVGLFSYLFASVAYLVLTILLLAVWRGRLSGMLMLLASLFTTIWAAFFASYRGGFDFPPTAVLHLTELARDAGWCLFLLAALGSGMKGAVGGSSQRSLIILFGSVFSAAFLVVAVIPLVSRLISVPDLVGKDAVLVVLVALAIVGLLLVEQLFRNTKSEDR